MICGHSTFAKKIMYILGSDQFLSKGVFWLGHAICLTMNRVKISICKLTHKYLDRPERDYFFPEKTYSPMDMNWLLPKNAKISPHFECVST